jgi:hypothetical protein
MTIKKNSERNDHSTPAAGHGQDEAVVLIVELTEEECELVAGGRRNGRDPEIPVVTDRC